MCGWSFASGFWSAREGLLHFCLQGTEWWPRVRHSLTSCDICLRFHSAPPWFDFGTIFRPAFLTSEWVQRLWLDPFCGPLFGPFPGPTLGPLSGLILGSGRVISCCWLRQGATGGEAGRSCMDGQLSADAAFWGSTWRLGQWADMGRTACAACGGGEKEARTRTCARQRRQGWPRAAAPCYVLPGHARELAVFHAV